MINFISPEDTVDEMTGKDVKHDKDQLSNAGAPHIRNHHVGQQGRVPNNKSVIIYLCIFVWGSIRSFSAAIPVCMSIIRTSSFPDMPCRVSEYSIVHICVFHLKCFSFSSVLSNMEIETSWQTSIIMSCCCPYAMSTSLRKVATARWVDMPIVFTHSAMAIILDTLK